MVYFCIHLFCFRCTLSSFWWTLFAPILGHMCLSCFSALPPPFDTLPYSPCVWCTCLYLSCFGCTFVSLLFLVHLRICPVLLCTSVHSHHPCVTLFSFWCMHTSSISDALLYLLHFSSTSPFAPFQDTSVFVLCLEHFCMCPGSDASLCSPHFSAFVCPLFWHSPVFVLIYVLVLVHFSIHLIFSALLCLSSFWHSSMFAWCLMHFCIYSIFDALLYLSCFQWTFLFTTLQVTSVFILFTVHFWVCPLFDRLSVWCTSVFIPFLVNFCICTVSGEAVLSVISLYLFFVVVVVNSWFWWTCVHFSVHPISSHFCVCPVF